MSVTDTLNRPLRDLRISLIDRCNFRCPYCMPSEKYHHAYQFLEKNQWLSFDEIVRLAKIFVGLGVTKLRLTGGEPLLRPDLDILVRQLSVIPGVKDLALTTNFVNSQIHMQMLSESLHTIGKKKVESKPENGVFKSSSRRFEPEYKIENFPGPGAYVSSSSKPNNEKKEPRKKENFVEKNTIIDEIMNQGNYQPVPSIPSNIHCLGYADLECFLNNKRLLFFMISNRQFFS